MYFQIVCDEIWFYFIKWFVEYNGVFKNYVSII